MKPITTNTLARWALVVVATYSIASLLLPGLWINTSMAVAGGVMAAFVVGTWTADAMYVFSEGKAEGEQLALLGVWLAAAGVLFTSIYTGSYYGFGRPTWWSDYPVAGIGRAATALGLLLFFLSPVATKEGIKPPKWWWYVTVAAGLSLFTLGLMLGQAAPDQVIDRSVPWR